MTKPTKKALKSTKAETEQKLFADTNVTMKSGHLTKDAALVSNDKFAKLRIASNKQYLDNQGEVATITNYFNILISQNIEEAFELAKGLKKGDWIYVKGEDSTQSFDTPEGYKQTACTIFASKLILKQVNSEEKADINKVVPKPQASKG